MVLNFALVDKLKKMIVDHFSDVLMILLFVIVSFIVYKVVMSIVKKILKLSRLDVLSDKLNKSDLVKKINLTINLSKIFYTTVKWVLLLLIFVIGADFLGLTQISAGLAHIISFLPTLLLALVILVLGGYIATKVRKIVYGILTSFDFNGAKALSSGAFVIIVGVTIIIVLNKLGIDTSIITDNLSIILGVLLASVSIALGLGSKEIVQRLLFGFYLRKSLKVGQRIRMDGVEGMILAIDNLVVIIQEENEKVIYPVKIVVNKKIQILS